MQKRSSGIFTKVFAVSSGLCSLFITGQAAGQTEIIETLTPDRGQFVYSTRITTDIDGDTALVASQLDERVIVFQREQTGSWQETAQLLPPPGIETFGLFGQLLAVGNNTAVVAIGPRSAENTLQIYKRNGDSWEPKAGITVPWQHDNAFHLSQSGNLLLVNSSDANAMIHKIYRIETDGSVVEEFTRQVTENVRLYPSPGICVHQNIAVIDDQWFQLTDGEWVNQGVTGIEVIANRRDPVYYSRDCSHAFYSSKNNDEPSSNVIYQLAGDDGWTEVHRFFGDRGFLSAVYNAVINEKFAIVQVDYIEDGENADFLLLERDESQGWTNKGLLNTEQSAGGFGHFLSLDNTTALISSFTPGEVGAYELSRFDELNSLQPVPDCLSGFSDPDGDGYGIENDIQCNVAANEIPIGDSRRDSLFIIDTGYTGPSPESLISDDTVVVEPAMVLAGDFAARLIQDGAEQPVVEILKTEDHLTWSVDATIDVSSLWQQVVVSSGYPPTVSAIRLDLDQQILAISFPAIGTSGFSGLIYIYERNSSEEWVQTAQLPGFSTDWDSYGQAISLANGVLAVRSGDVGGEGGADGAIFIFEKENGVWGLESTLAEPRPYDPQPQIGYSLSIESDVLLLANEVRGFYFTEVYARDENRRWEHQQSLYIGDGKTKIDSVDLLSQNTALVELNGKIHVFDKDANEIWRESAVTTGGDMVIRHGRLWASDTPILPETGAGNQLFPVEFLNRNNSSSGGGTATISSGGGSFSLFYLLGMWGLIIMNRKQRVRQAKFSWRPGNWL